ncbi:hypothetical protein [Undibacter mobilis]|uniref:Uncharacterized protein n=1 Tax=Undibacter mobilis TaxID=2292256 RepID=A0A371BDG5_9BRAD|nr:hypothetical protein [Undibacter mobilis]RDV05632.1 hypothetical protein DXH78_00970 [Undibacter mobilis]
MSAESEPEPLTPEQEAAVAKVRRLMLISSATLVIGVAAVFGVIGYKVFTSGDSPAADKGAPHALIEAVDPLPPGGKVVGTAIGEAQIVVTIEAGGATELRTYDPDTLRPLGRLRLAPAP